MATNTSVFGIYSSRENAENGVERLACSGFSHENISVLLKDNVGVKDVAKNTKAPEGAATGVLAGGVIGGALGLLAHIGVLAIPGFGPLVAVGPIIAALTGIGSGTLMGGIIGALVGAGIPEYEAKRYEGHIRAGGILLAVQCDGLDWIAKAKDVLKQTGAEDISSSGDNVAACASSDPPFVRGAGR